MNSNNRLGVSLEIQFHLESLSPVTGSADHTTINSLSTVLDTKGREHINGSEKSRMRPSTLALPEMGSAWE